MTAKTIHHPERRHQERRASQAASPSAEASGKDHMEGASYGRFAAMVAASTVIGFGAMYLNIYALDHLYFSWNRVFMGIVMGGVMTLVMMLFMWKMYPRKSANYAVMGLGAALVATGFGLAQTQATVGDVDWMKAMIPHHSIAILTSERADISDPRVNALARQIMDSQRSEISEMKALIVQLENR